MMDGMKKIHCRIHCNSDRYVLCEVFFSKFKTHGYFKLLTKKIIFSIPLVSLDNEFQKGGL